MKGKLVWELIDSDGNVVEHIEEEIVPITKGILECINIIFKRGKTVKDG